MTALTGLLGALYPPVFARHAVAMLDLTARHRIRTAVDDFTAGRITAFALNDRLQDIRTTDATATTVIKLLWYTYDDCKDHGAERWIKPTWDLPSSASA